MSRSVKNLRNLISHSRRSTEGGLTYIQEDLIEGNALKPPEITQEKNKIENNSSDLTCVENLSFKLSKLKVLSEKDKELVLSLQDRLDTQEEEHRRQLEKRSFTISHIQHTLENFTKLYNAEKSEFVKLQNEHTELKSKFDREHSLASEAKVNSSNLKSLVQKLKEERSVLEDTIANYKKQEECMKARFSERDVRLKAECKSLKQQLSERSAEIKSRSQEFASDLNELENCKSQLEANVSSLRYQAQELTNENADLRKQLDDKHSEIHKSKTESEKEYDEQKRKYNSVSFKHASLQKSFMQFKTDHDTLLKRMKTRHELNQNDMKRQCDDENVALRSQVEILTKEKNSLEDSIRSVSSSRSQLLSENADLCQKCKHLEHVRDQLNGELENMRIVSKEAIEKFEYQRTVHQNALKELRNEISDNEKKLSISEENRKILQRRMDSLSIMESEVTQAVDKLLRVYAAMEGSFTCTVCMKPFKEPKTCYPCGHTFCESCLSSTKTCQECKSDFTDILDQKRLSDLSGKFSFSAQVLARLRQEVGESDKATMVVKDPLEMDA
eukprot:259072_1